MDDPYSPPSPPIPSADLPVTGNVSPFLRQGWSGFLTKLFAISVGAAVLSAITSMVVVSLIHTLVPMRFPNFIPILPPILFGIPIWIMGLSLRGPHQPDEDGPFRNSRTFSITLFGCAFFKYLTGTLMFVDGQPVNIVLAVALQLIGHLPAAILVIGFVWRTNAVPLRWELLIGLGVATFFLRWAIGYVCYVGWTLATQTLTIGITFHFFEATIWVLSVGIPLPFLGTADAEMSADT